MKNANGELISLRRDRGAIVADIEMYTWTHSYFTERRFVWYPIKEIIRILRADGITCSHDNCKLVTW